MSFTKVKGAMIDGNIDASQLQGTLPALDAANLTNVDAEKVLKGNGAPTTNINPAGGVGTLYVNTANGEILICTNSTTDANVWMNSGVGNQNVIPPGPMVATGGDEVVTSATHKYHIFTSSGQLNVATATNGAQWDDTLDIFMVAGGGAGGKGEWNASGGGGAGGAKIWTGQTNLAVGTYDIIVGAGGVGLNTMAFGGHGNNSSLKSATLTYPDFETTGGGGGWGDSWVAGSVTTEGGGSQAQMDGGSGAGGWNARGYGVSGEGHNGGSTADGNAHSKGGGGGWGQEGRWGSRYHDPSGGYGGNGKNDAASWVTDIANSGGQTYGADNGYFAGGGGGGSAFLNGIGDPIAPGGLGGGGNGNNKISTAGNETPAVHAPNLHTPGAVNTGSGGGGTQFYLYGNDGNWNIGVYGHEPATAIGGSGGSGIVIIRYAL